MGLFRLHLTILGPFLKYSKGSLKMVQRVTYRRRLSYNTKSNRRKIVRTPGGKLVFQYPKTGIRLKGVKPMRPSEKSRHSLRHKKVYRAYGGVLSHKAVREKIVRAFLIEEQKVVMKVLKAQKAAKE